MEISMLRLQVAVLASRQFENIDINLYQEGVSAMSAVCIG